MDGTVLLYEESTLPLPGSQDQCIPVSWTLAKLITKCWAVAVFDMIEYIMVKAGVTQRLSMPQWVARLVYRSIYCVLVAFIAILLPFFGGELTSRRHWMSGFCPGLHFRTV